MDVSGKIKLIGETQTFGEKGFRKRELVITTSEEYPQMLMIEFVQDKTDLLDSYAVGQDVTISINLRGREWINPEGVAKYFNSIQGWRIQASTSATTTSTTSAEPQVASAPAPATEDLPVAEEESDDLPF